MGLRSTTTSTSAQFIPLLGAVECCVANCGQEEYNTHPKSDMTVDAYIEYIRCYQQQGYPANMDCLYLKDWHFTK